MRGNRRLIQFRNRSFTVSIPPALAADKGITQEAAAEKQLYAEWRSFPTSEEGWRQMLRESPNALVLVPVEEE